LTPRQLFHFSQRSWQGDFAADPPHPAKTPAAQKSASKLRMV
jgi:hypothetical protein